MAADHFSGDPRTMAQRMADGDLYIADDPELEHRYQHALWLADAYGKAYLDRPEIAGRLLGELLGSVGAGVHVRPGLRVDYGRNLHLGERTFVNYNLTALDVATIRVGADCQIGPGVQLLTPTHPVDPTQRRDKLEAAAPITIGDNVWLGGGVIVCPGVTIGDDSVIGAGAVVVKDIPAGVVAAGNPARVLRTIAAA